jgi:hypothetical protein
MKIDRATHMLFPGLYIRLKAADKQNKIPEHLFRRVTLLMKANEKGQSALSRPQDLAIIQGVALQVNGEKLAKPAARQAIFMTSTARDAVAEVLAKAYEAGIDVFDPDNGHCIEISSIPPGAGRATASFTATLGQKMRIPEDQCRALWTPWDLGYATAKAGETAAQEAAREAKNADNAAKQGLKLLTFEEQKELALACFGEELLEFAFPEYFKDRVASAPAPVRAPAPRPTPPKPAPVEEPEELRVDVNEAPQQVDAADDELIDMTARVTTPAAVKPVDKPKGGAPSPDELQAQIAALLEQQQALMNKK